MKLFADRSDRRSGAEWSPSLTEGTGHAGLQPCRADRLSVESDTNMCGEESIVRHGPQGCGPLIWSSRAHGCDVK